jgi:hypothetical protein
MLRRRRVPEPSPAGGAELDQAETIAEINHLRIEQGMLRRVGERDVDCGDRIDALLEHLAALRAHT